MTEAPEFEGDFAQDTHAAVDYYAELGKSIANLPPRPERTDAQNELADAAFEDGRRSRVAFMKRYAGEVYDQLTDGCTKNPRTTELTYAAADQFPGLVPTRAQIVQEREYEQKDKDGWEVDQGIFLSRILDNERAGYHLMHAMTQPRVEALDLLEEFKRTGIADLGSTLLERKDNIGYLTIQHHQYLNAEDNDSTARMETATDLVLLDDQISVGVLRGGEAEHRKYVGRRVFDSGVNLTKLYFGQVSLIEFFIDRELGLLNKWYRGHSIGDGTPSVIEERHEKPWVAGVETHAIGGGCQFLLVMDRVVAQSGSYFNLPAKREGFLPGCGNMRLPRFVGERATRQGVFFNKNIYADSPQGAMVADELVESPEEMDAALVDSVDMLTSTGPVGVNANKTQMRVGVESLEELRRYMANLAIHQARCMYSPAIIKNLEIAWNARLADKDHAGAAR